MKIDIKPNEWEHYIARPFSLFVATLWHEWYNADKAKELFGQKVDEGLYIEHPKGMTRSYRKVGQIQKFNSLIHEIALTDYAKAKKFLKEAQELNKKAQEHIDKQDIKDLKESVDFVISLTLLSTIFPYFAAEGLQKNKIEEPKIVKLCKELREVSYYPDFLNGVVMPLVKKELVNRGITLEGADLVVTYNEVINNSLDIGVIKKRLELTQAGKAFVYYSNGKKEEIDFVDDPTKLINEIELSGQEEKIVKGTTAYGGVAKGIARLIFSNDLSNVKFNDGDIIVASSTNPALTPLMMRASAFVTDEGGMMSHAAILSRELHRPCVVGTKTATKLLKDGDLIEVDGDNGIVRKLS